MGRSNVWLQSQENPSLSSTRKFVFSFTSLIGFDLNEPDISAIRAAATKNDAASIKKGKNIATPTKRLPSGGPINEFVSASADHIRPLAFSKFSTSTTDGKNVCAALSRKTSAKPKSRADIRVTK